MKFEYYEIRPCVEVNGHVASYLGDPEFCNSRGADIFTPGNAKAEAAEALMDAIKTHGSAKMFWTLYGRDEEGLAHAIGDFKSFDFAYEVMVHILAPLVEIRDLIGEGEGGLVAAASKALSVAEDVCNQSTTEERI